MMESLKACLVAVVAGNVGELPLLQSCSHAEILNASAQLPQLIVSRSALVNVLRTWRSGNCDADMVQNWASFVRRGYIARNESGRLGPIDIAYDENDEDLIVEIISRFDELGDDIDGEINNNEQEQMLNLLEQKQ